MTKVSAPCMAKHALRQGLRPLSQTGSLRCGVCLRRCIFCDIWKLAILLSTRYSGLMRRKSRRGDNVCHPSPGTSASYSATKAITLETQFQLERARLGSIISMCTVEGVEDYNGLRIARDQCLHSVQNLISQSYMMEHQKAALGTRLWDARTNTTPALRRKDSSRSYDLRETYASQFLMVGLSGAFAQ